MWRKPWASGPGRQRWSGWSQRARTARCSTWSPRTEVPILSGFRPTRCSTVNPSDHLVVGGIELTTPHYLTLTAGTIWRYRRGMATYYDAFAQLAHVYLEDSWVLAVWPSDNMLAFDIEAVLTQEHPEYRGPATGYQYDFRLALLTLSGHVACVLSGAPPASSADGTTDLGNIDSWTVDDAGVSLLEGVWGEARVSDTRVEFALTGS